MRWLRATILLAISIPLLWSFGSTLTGAHVCAYRDTASFYYPLYAWTSGCWTRGEIPLWNPQENIGTPVAAEATSAVFYPGQLIFLIPLNYSLKFNLYLLAHVVLAALGAFLLARHLLARRDLDRHGSRPSVECAPVRSVDAGQLRLLSAGLCALCYAFSGAVLFQYCNIVFLVGAAWLPFALLAADCMLATRRLAWSLGLGACLALMVLGGDPQMAYHTGLLAALLAWLRYLACKSRGASPSSHTRAILRQRHRHALCLLATAAITGVLLSALQIVPALALTSVSERATLDRPTNLAESLFGKPPQATHREQIYDFSVAPWRVTECLWPNISGHMFPVNQRWLSALRAEDRVWTPTLYLGLMPLLLALTMWRLRAGDWHVRWLSVVALGALIGSFGWYGLGWLAGELQRAWTGIPPTLAVAEPAGGLYWLMVKLLPGYAYFRYPAKLLTIASLAVCLLAGMGLERALVSGRKQICRWLVVVGLCSISTGLAFAACGLWWADWFRDVVPDELFGPLDARGAWLGCLTATMHAAVLCGFFWWLFRQSSWSPIRVGRVILMVTAVELAWANGSHVMTAPASALSGPAILSSASTAVRLNPMPNSTNRTGEANEVTQRIYRPPRRRWVPRQWMELSDPQRGEETVRWDRATLFPKYHLLGSFGSVDSMNTMSSRDYRALIRVAGQNYPHSNVLDLLGVRYLVLPRGTDWPGGIPCCFPTERTRGTMSIDNVQVWENPTAMPRAWVVHQVESWPRDVPVDRASLEERFRHLLLPHNLPRDFRHSATVREDTVREDTAEPNTATMLAAHAGDTSETCRVVERGTCRVEVDATLMSPGLLVLSNQYDPGWSVDVTSNGSTTRRAIACTNGVMQGVFLPPGQHHLVFRYAPRAFYVAASVSIVSWLLCLGVGVWQGVGRMRECGGEGVRE